ncbi:MAG: MBL fold metallo-hydrolase [Clostridiales bacterium]|nr:MBL fold metallo-hydrolase [Clostridiales bacterium]
MNKLKIITLPVGSMRTNCYILRDEETDIGAIVDPGGETAESGYGLILAKCASEVINVKYILLTHVHFDHILSLEQVREATGAPVCVHKYDAEALTDPNLSYMAQFAGIDEPCRPAERLLDDGDIITLGNSEISVIHTPGHTIGSVCYRSGDSILTGDTLFCGSIGRCDLYGGDEIAISQSLRLLKSLADEGDFKLYPGHGNTTTLTREIKNNIYLR